MDCLDYIIIEPERKSGRYLQLWMLRDTGTPTLQRFCCERLLTHFTGISNLNLKFSKIFCYRHCGNISKEQAQTAKIRWRDFYARLA